MSDEREHVGSLAEEAAKLFAALQDRAGESGGEYATAAAGVAEGLADMVTTVNEHIATDSEECRFCPLCRAVALVRGTHPEVRQHLSAAGTSLMHAFVAAMSTDGRDQQARRDDTAGHTDRHEGQD